MLERLIGSAVIVAGVFSLAACGPSRTEPDAGVDAGYDPCPTGCPKVDAGTDGGVTDGGVLPDGGVFAATVEALRASTVPTGSKVKLEDVVVSAVSYAVKGSAGDYQAEFWVTDPQRPQQGIWVRKFYTDLPGPYLPTVGDKLTVVGWYGNESKFDERRGYRRVVKSQYDFGKLPGKLELEKTSDISPPVPVAVLSGQFGNSEGGSVLASLENAGAVVHVQGPLEITDPSPTAFKRQSANPDDPVYFGFEVSGGILVNNYKTFSADGGCAWRDVALAADGGTVVFAGGVKGVWDTFTHAPCTDGGTASNCFPRNEGHIPGTDASYTFVLYPQSCDDYVDGEVQ